MSIRNLDALFEPRSIALIGAGTRSGESALARNLFGAGFKGPIATVGAGAAVVPPAVDRRSIAELPFVPDLAVVAGPAAEVPAIVADLAARGCRAAVVTSAGSAQGHSALLQAARPHLLRIVGPSCMGVISPGSGINASTAHLMPRNGHLAFVSQSGAVASAVLDWADIREIGFSHVVALGDMIDVDVGDLLDYLALDARTRAILLYVETLTDARKFMTAARIAARAKPVVVIKAGRSEAGAEAATSHTGALAGSDAVYDAVFRRAGMLRVGSLRELFEAVGTLASGIRLKGDRLAVLTNGGGPGVLAVDALADHGGRLSDLSPETVARLDAILPAGRSGRHPIDVSGEAADRLYAEILPVLLADPAQDAVLVMNHPQAMTDGTEAARAVVSARRDARGAPLLTCWLGERAARDARRIFAAEGVPTYQTPDEAVRAFAQLVDYRRNQDLLMQTPPAIAPADTDLEAARRLIHATLGEDRRVMSEPEAKAFLKTYGIPVVRTQIATSPLEAARLAAAIGFPVALKILSADILHKSDVGGVRLELDTPERVVEAAEHMLRLVAERRPDARIDGFTVQAMVRRSSARELFVGAHTDAIFGPVLLFGQGGTAVEVIADRAIGLPPLNHVLARDMIGRTKVSRLLGGYRDRPAVDVDAVAHTLVTLSQMVCDFDEIAELDINPLIADANGVLTLDARLALHAARGPRRAHLAIQPYPAELERTARTRKGAFRLRPIRPEDEPAIVEMIERCDPEDVRLRFFAPIRRIGHAFAARLTQIDYDREMAFVALPESGTVDAILGVARLIADPDGEKAEFGVMVRSDQKGQGLGYLLMEAILEHAGRRGIAAVHGEVLAENTTMLAMARNLGFSQRVHPEDAGLRRVEIAIGGFGPSNPAAGAGSSASR